MATETRHYTRADLADVPDDGRRYEVLDGELLVTPQAGLPHQWIATELAGELRAYLRQHRLGQIYASGAVVFDQNELQPDVQVVLGEMRPAPDGRWEDINGADLVVEVLSLSTKDRDLGKKRAAYQRLRIPTYWIVDRFERRVLIFSPDAAEPEIVTDVLRWQPRRDIPPFEIRLAALIP